MFSYARRFLLAPSLLLVALLGSSADTSESKPTPKQIAQWVEQLGDNDFKVREDATKKLWHAGAAAESALEKALTSEDREMVRRARDLLDKFHWGIYPDTPPDIVALIRAYQSSEGNSRMGVFRQLLDSGDAGLRAVIKIAAAEKDANQRRMLGDVIVDKLPPAFFLAVTERKYEQFESLLEFGHEGKFIAPNQYATYWLLRGKLPERIAHFAARLREHPDDKWLAQTLAYLHRANGDLIAARKAAEKSDRADLVEGILYEMGGWKTLAARPVAIEGEKLKHGRGRYIIQRPIDVASGWAYHAAFARLAGKQQDFENAVHQLRQCAEPQPTRERDNSEQAWMAAKGLLLNDRPAEGLALLRTVPEHRQVLFDILCARLDFTAALDLAKKESQKGKGIAQLGLARARLLCLLGEKEGKELFDRYAERIEDEFDPDWVNSLLAEEIRAGLMDRAFLHAAKALKALSVAQPKSWRDFDKEAPVRRFLAQLFPQQPWMAEVWWTLRRLKYEDESADGIHKSLLHLRELLEGKLSTKEIKELIDAAEIQWSGSSLLSSVRKGLAEAAVHAGFDDLASSLLERIATREGSLRLGDLMAAKKQWGRAAEHYRQAWAKQLQGNSASAAHDPLPLYLVGDALIRSGKEKEGKKLIEQAHWIPFANTRARFNFLTALAERGHKEAAQREAELMLRASEPNSLHSTKAIYYLALRARARKEHLQAAVGLEQSIMACFKPGVNFVGNSAYTVAPAQIHQLWASAMLAAGKVDEALKHMELTLAAAPGYPKLPIALVPELERRGHKKEAADLFNRCYGAYDKVCRAYPRYAEAHNEAAWISACCRRNLDAALAHAQKAVELVPTRAGYLDTLAEVHFQRGDKDKAIALQKRVIELNPKRGYYRKQLKRLEAGDLSSERPPDNDDE